MTFSNPQPIPSRSSHPSHHRPTFRRTQSHNLTSTTSSSSTPTATDGKYNYFDSAINSQDDTIYDHDDDDEEQETYGRPHDSGHYISDMDDDSSLSGIPIGKPGCYPNFFSTAATSGGMDVRANLNRRSHPAPGSNYSPFRANGDGHHSVNLLAHNTNDASHNNFSKSATAPINIPSSPNTFAIVSSTSSTTSSPSHIASIKIPQHANKSSEIKTQAFNNTQTHAHYPHPNISIDTSKARLRPPVLQKASSREELPDAQKAVAPSSSSSFSTKAKQGQLTLGLKKDDKEKEKDKVLSSSLAGTSLPYSTFAAISTSSATRPMMMGNPSRSSSALPPAAPTHQDSSSVLLPSLSPSSPRANSALVNSLEQLSVSWKAPEQTPTFPINRLHRSRTMSSGTRPYINTSSFSSNSSDSNLTNYVSPPSMVTSSSYSSLPYSPAVAFLSNFVEATAPRMAPDEEGEQVGDFIMGKVIGHGGFSVVREAFAIHMDGLVARVAVKVVKTQTGAANNDRVQRMLDKEIAIWSRLSHPNVLPFLAVEKLATSTFVFCELCTGGQLLDYLTKNGGASSGSSGRSGLEECKAREIFNQIAEAVRYLHEEKRIVHRDIKLENVLQHEDGTWKICDFGLAEYQNDEAASYFGSPMSPTIYNPRAKSQIVPGDSPIQSSDNDDEYTGEEEDDVGGSLAYCSPEQLRSQKPLRCPSSDVWSLGVVLYALLTGRLPFQDEYEPRLQYQILNGRYEEPTECSAEARELLKNMFRAKPEDRWKIGQVLDSPWCTGTLQAPTTNTGASFGNMNMGGFFSSYRA
ncbi:hypothetical protein BGZ82_002829 [Podila clonocystis]|nr:hypothetical protein BGZ82_002829 [Podila clonocystis]